MTRKIFVPLIIFKETAYAVSFLIKYSENII